MWVRGHYTVLSRVFPLESTSRDVPYIGWLGVTATTCLADDLEPPPILVHGCNGVSRTSAFVATSMLCKSLRMTGEMSPVEVWARLNSARHNAAKERIHFLSSIECALLYAVDNGLLQANHPQLAQVNKVGFSL
ncbi:hypothetical protein TELCIR_09225 [Teladorsagia circumcincta]|uniref:Tyrosine-protein phosphatase domain-containing protein n=1 Tax=Teladorsagia circumcincta TaxID=45464 RepID=A0A2G9UFE9_TELCI|nr:hypothetical protein TELCIR_09225 [Teladorsagia circumcincta]